MRSETTECDVPPGDVGGAQLHVDPQARAYLLAHGGALTLRRSPRHGCCGGVAEVIVAEAGVPERGERYAEVTCKDLRDLKVFLERGLRLRGRWRVGLDALWRWRHLWVEHLDG